MAILTIPEKIFRDPVHDFISIQHQVILDLINTREFQRLRRIKQLGTAGYTFHGAEHTRFAHCLGVYEITRRICNHFSKNYPSHNKEDGLWDDNERLVVTCAALLHDVGHGAFSHTFEKIFATNHEEVTIQMILDGSTEINQVLRSISERFPHQVAAVISHTYPNPQVVQLISSQCDADRMDYLLRDSYYTGANYGTFDLNRILRVMRPSREGIIFDFAGMHAIEDYVISRYQMYMQVYFHPVSRSMEVILNRLLRRARDIYTKEPQFFERYSPFLVPFFKDNFSLEDYLALDDGVMNTYFAQWIQYSDDALLIDLAKRFIYRKPFKSVTYNHEKQQQELALLGDYIQKLGYDVNYYMMSNSSFDLPYDFYRPNTKSPRTQIELCRKDGTMIELSKASPIIRAFTGQHIGDERLYFPSELYKGKQPNDISLFDPTLHAIHTLTANGRLKDLSSFSDTDE